MHSPEPTSAYSPALHLTQAVPALEGTLPAAHWVQLVDPGLEEKYPEDVSHALQTSSSRRCCCIAKKGAAVGSRKLLLLSDGCCAPKVLWDRSISRFAFDAQPQQVATGRQAAVEATSQTESCFQWQAAHYVSVPQPAGCFLPWVRCLGPRLTERA